MTVTNREARQWDQVQHQAMLRRIAKQRQEAVKPFLEAREQQQALAEQKTAAKKQGRLF